MSLYCIIYLCFAFIQYYTVLYYTLHYYRLRHSTGYPIWLIISVTVIQVSPLGYFIHISITAPIVSALKNYSGFHLDPQLGSREHNAAKNHLNRALFGLRPLYPVVWGGVFCQMGINPKVTVI